MLQLHGPGTLKQPLVARKDPYGKAVTVDFVDMYQVVAVVLDVIYVIIRCLFERQKQHSVVKLSVHSVVQCFPPCSLRPFSLSNPLAVSSPVPS